MKANDIIDKLKDNGKLTLVDYLGRPIECCATTNDGRIVLSIKKPVGKCRECGEYIFETIGARAWCITCNKTKDIWQLN